MWQRSRLNNQPWKWFLLTHPVWDVTSISVSPSTEDEISTHTSRVGCDADLIARPALVCISTHTSRVGCDVSALYKCITDIYFYSHIPCGMWPVVPSSRSWLPTFLLTHPVWDVTGHRTGAGRRHTFLLTHPVWDVTAYGDEVTTWNQDFYSHIPCGMWRSSAALVGAEKKFLLTHPVWDVTTSR